MKKLLLGLALTTVFAAPAFAALKVGDMAPDFTATASLGGKDFTFKLNEALKKGPAVVYFYPSAYTGGCDLEAHTFAESHEKFAAAGASIIGVSADNLERLNQFAADPDFLRRQIPHRVGREPGDRQVLQSQDHAKPRQAPRMFAASKSAMALSSASPSWSARITRSWR